MNIFTDNLYEGLSYIFHKLWFLVLIAPLAVYRLIWLFNGQGWFEWEHVAFSTFIIAALYLFIYNIEAEDLRSQVKSWRESYEHLAKTTNDPDISRIIQRKEHLKNAPRAKALNSAGLKGLIKYLRETGQLSPPTSSPADAFKTERFAENLTRHLKNTGQISPKTDEN